MKHKIHWSEVVTYILNELFLSQKELADICKVTQQSISNWKNNVRNPGPYAKKQLTNILENAGVNIAAYREGFSEEVLKTDDVALKELIDIYFDLPSEAQNTLMEFARFSTLKAGKQ